MVLVLVSYNNTELLIQIGIIHSKMFILSSSTHPHDIQICITFFSFHISKNILKTELDPFTKTLRHFSEQILLFSTESFFLTKNQLRRSFEEKKVFNEQTQCGKL